MKRMDLSYLGDVTDDDGLLHTSKDHQQTKHKKCLCIEKAQNIANLIPERSFSFIDDDIWLSQTASNKNNRAAS